MKKKLFTVKYKHEKFKVTLWNKIRIELIELVLFCKRQYRRVRTLVPTNFTMYLLLTLCWILYGALVLMIGKKYKVSEIYTIFDVAWDLKSSYFTSVILAIFIGGYNQIVSYKEKIQVQHDFYVDAMSNFESLFYPVLGGKILFYHIFYNDICLDDTFKYIETGNVFIEYSEIKYADIIRDIFTELNKIDEARKENRIIGMDRDFLKYKIETVKKDLNKLKKDKKLDIYRLKEIASDFFYIVAELRRPWRWDIDNNIKILKMINENPQNKVEQDFYYGMHLNGYKLLFEKNKIDDE